MLLLLACSEPAPAPLVDVDTLPGRRTVSASGAQEAIVAPGGALRIGANGRTIDTRVDPRLAISADDALLVYTRETDEGTTDLWRVRLPDGAPERLTDWPDSEDRPTFSPDGRRVAFVSGRTGIAAWWVIELPTAGLATEARQLTNFKVERRPGQPPDGWIPVPDGTTYAWTDAGLTWVAEGQRWSVTP